MNYIFRKLHVDSPHLNTISRPLSKTELEQNISEVLALQLTELKQLDQTGNFGNKGLGELLLGQIEHLSGQADDSGLVNKRSNRVKRF